MTKYLAALIISFVAFGQSEIARAKSCSDIFLEDHAIRPLSQAEELIQFSELFATTPKKSRIELLRQFRYTKATDESLRSTDFIAAPTADPITAETKISLLGHGIYLYEMSPLTHTQEVARILTIDHALVMNLELPYRPVTSWWQLLLTGTKPPLDRFQSPAYLLIQDRLQVLTKKLQTLPETERKAAFEVLSAMLQYRPRLFFNVLRCQKKLTRDSFRLRELKIKMSLWEIAKAAFQNPAVFWLGVQAVETAIDGL